MGMPKVPERTEPLKIAQAPTPPSDVPRSPHKVSEVQLDRTPPPSPPPEALAPDTSTVTPRGPTKSTGKRKRPERSPGSEYFGSPGPSQASNTPAPPRSKRRQLPILNEGAFNSAFADGNRKASFKTAGRRPLSGLFERVELDPASEKPVVAKTEGSWPPKRTDSRRTAQEPRKRSPSSSPILTPNEVKTEPSSPERPDDMESSVHPFSQLTLLPAPMRPESPPPSAHKKQPSHLTIDPDTKTKLINALAKLGSLKSSTASSNASAANGSREVPQHPSVPDVEEAHNPTTRAFPPVKTSVSLPEVPPLVNKARRISDADGREPTVSLTRISAQPEAGPSRIRKEEQDDREAHRTVRFNRRHTLATTAPIVEFQNPPPPPIRFPLHLLPHARDTSSSFANTSRRSTNSSFEYEGREASLEDAELSFKMGIERMLVQIAEGHGFSLSIAKKVWKELGSLRAVDIMLTKMGQGAREVADETFEEVVNTCGLNLSGSNGDEDDVGGSRDDILSMSFFHHTDRLILRPPRGHRKSGSTLKYLPVQMLDDADEYTPPGNSRAAQYRRIVDESYHRDVEMS